MPIVVSTLLTATLCYASSSASHILPHLINADVCLNVTVVVRQAALVDGWRLAARRIPLICKDGRMRLNFDTFCRAANFEWLLRHLQYEP